MTLAPIPLAVGTKIYVASDGDPAAYVAEVAEVLGDQYRLASEHRWIHGRIVRDALIRIANGFVSVRAQYLHN